MKLLLTISFIVAVSFSSGAQLNTSSKALLIDSVLVASHEKGIFNGVVLVADKGEVIYKKGIGVADYGTKTPLDANDRFYIGSMTKQFTAMLIYKLHDRELLDIYQPFPKYLHQFRGKIYKEVTIYNLLTHTSGIPSYNLLRFFDKSKDYSTDEMYKLIKAKPLEFEPGKDFMYSNSGYFLLGKIIERVTKKSYGEVLKNEILIPLGMTNTAYETTWLENKVAKGYFMTVDGMSDMPKYSLSTLYSSGGMYSTIDDLYKWDQALYTNKLLGDSLKYLMFTPKFNDYASGWRVHRGYEDSVYFERHQHGGMIEGYHTFILRRIPQQQTVIILDNFYHNEVQSIKNSIWSILEGRKGWIPKRMLSQFLYKSIVEGKLTKSLEDINVNKGAYEYDYNFEEYDINTVGYKLMTLGRLDEAKQIFEFNLSLFPDSWNVHDSFGEYYLKIGRLGESKLMYEKSLILNPKNESAKIALAKIEKLLKKKK